MNKNKLATLVPVAVIAGVLAVAACGPNTGAKARAHASALATSSTGQQAKGDAKTLFAKCVPTSASGQLALLETGNAGKSARTAVVTCGGVPKQHWKDAAGCVLTHVEHGGKLPSDPAARHQALINDAFPCAQQYQGAK